MSVSELKTKQTEHDAAFEAWRAHKYPDAKTWTVAGAQSIASKIASEEHARLIAAAPEMLEALLAVAETIRESFRDVSRNGEHDTQWCCPLCGASLEHDDGCAALDVERAIAKATGGAS